MENLIKKAYEICLLAHKGHKDEIWKVAAHEFTHCFFSMGHCKANDPHCIMQDANKHPNFSIKDKLCDKCKTHVKPILQKQ